MPKSDEHQQAPKDYPPGYFKVNQERHDHLIALENSFIKQIGSQHRKGQREHGGDLWKQACFARAKPEVIDLFTYLCEHERRMKLWVKYLDKALLALEDDAIETVHGLIEMVRDQIKQELEAETAEEVYPE